jgi:hypothetical protein
MKPSIFIVHWTNTAGLAEAVKGALEPRYNVHLGDRPAEATSSEAWAILAQTLPWFDFAILIPAAAEVLPFPEDAPDLQTARAGFVGGLFLGALGPQRVFVIVQQTRGMGMDVAEAPSFFGSTVIPAPVDAHGEPDRERVREAINSLSEMINERQEHSPLQILLSTVLAHGYFNNFMLPVGRTLAALDSIMADGIRIDIRGRRFRIEVVLPRTLAEAGREG